MKNVMPFMFYIPVEFSPGVVIDAKKVERDEYHVVVASFGYSFEDTDWMADERLGKNCLVPSVDQEKEHHVFYSEAEAMKFMSEWWSRQKSE